MKILIGMTRSDTTMSGSFTHISQIGREFRRRGAEVVYVLGGSGPAADRLKEEGFKVKSIPILVRNIDPVKDLLGFFWLLWITLTEWPSVCSWHTSKIGALGRLVSAVLFRRSYYIAHGVPFVNTPENTGHELYARLEKLLGLLPAQIICVCEFDRKEFMRIGVSPRKLFIIQNGMVGRLVDKPSVPDAAAVTRFVTAARFEKQKDYATLAAACHVLNDRGLNFELHVYGNGPMESEAVDRFGVLMHSKVFFHGTVKNFAEVLPEYDVFVLSSHWEGLPRSLIEAMACRMPLVASDVGGVSELIQTGHNGYLIAHRDVAGFAQAMADYIVRPELIGLHGAGSLAIYQDNYTLDVMLDRYCAVYLQ